MYPITSPANGKIKLLRSLSNKKTLLENSLFVIEGANILKDAPEGFIEEVFVRESDIGKYAALCERLTDRAYSVADEVFDRVSNTVTSAGIVATARIPEPRPVTGRFVAVLDGISDPGNLGTIVRTASAAGYKHIYLKDCADPFNPKAVRASMSGVFGVTLYETGEDFARYIRLPIYAADMGGENIFTFAPPEQFALCIGNEGSGLSKQVREKASFTVRIPMGEHTESLNAAVSAGILMYELKRTTFI